MRIVLVSFLLTDDYRSMKYQETARPASEFLSEADEQRAREIAQNRLPDSEGDAFFDYVLENYPNWEPMVKDGKRVGVQHRDAGRL